LLPLRALALAFANLANPAGLAPVRAAACQRVSEAVTAHPLLLAGEGRLCTALLRAAPGRLMPKNGAEGVYACGVTGLGIGIAIKVDDGAERGYLPVLIELLLALGVWDALPEGLRDFHRVPLRNTQKILVGEVVPALDLGRLLSPSPLLSPPPLLSPSALPSPSPLLSPSALPSPLLPPSARPSPPPAPPPPPSTSPLPGADGR
jgi:hypothetical protein